MLRKVLIAFCLLTSLATLALWADSFRPRYTLAELGVPVCDDGSRGRPIACDPGDDTSPRMRQAIQLNSETSSWDIGVADYLVRVGLTRRMIPIDATPNAAEILDGHQIAIDPVSQLPTFHVYLPGIASIQLLNMSRAGQGTARSGRMFTGSRFGFYVLRTGPLGSAGAVHAIALPLWRVSVLVLLVALSSAVGPARRWHRRRRGLCVKCAYDLRGTISDRCPECGTPITGRTQRAGP